MDRVDTCFKDSEISQENQATIITLLEVYREGMQISLTTAIVDILSEFLPMDNDIDLFDRHSLEQLAEDTSCNYVHPVDIGEDDIDDDKLSEYYENLRKGVKPKTVLDDIKKFLNINN